MCIIVFFIDSNYIDDILNADIQFAEQCENKICAEEIKKLENDIACCMSEYEKCKQKYQTALVDNLKRDLMLDNLTEQKKENRFNDFKKVFSLSSLTELKCMGPNEREDSSFVLTAVRNLYAENLAALQKKTLTGASKNDTTEAMSPKKVDILRNVYAKRMEYMEEDCLLDNKNRKKNCSKHINIALQTIKRNEKK